MSSFKRQKIGGGLLKSVGKRQSLLFLCGKIAVEDSGSYKKYFIIVKDKDRPEEYILNRKYIVFQADLYPLNSEDMTLKDTKNVSKIGSGSLWPKKTVKGQPYLSGYIQEFGSKKSKYHINIFRSMSGDFCIAKEKKSSVLFTADIYPEKDVVKKEEKVDSVTSGRQEKLL